MVILYCITCLVTGKMYVGITSGTLDYRWAGHLHKSRKGSKLKFHNAVRKYGAAAFERAPLYSYPDVEQAKQAERALIAALDLVATGYNTSPGGDEIYSWKGRERTPEHIANHTRALKGRYMPPRSEAAKAKQSAAISGRKYSKEHCEKIAAKLRGKPLTEERRAKISDSRRRNHALRLAARWQAEDALHV